MKIKTSDLVGRVLDWAVATCEGYSDLRVNPHAWDNELIMTPPKIQPRPVYLFDLDFGANWALSGPIIDREKISISCWGIGVPDAYDAFILRFTDGGVTTYKGNGKTNLISAMRCYCCAKLGEEIEIPQELCNEKE
jgi:hypothetical protein